MKLFLCGALLTGLLLLASCMVQPVATPTESAGESVATTPTTESASVPAGETHTIQHAMGESVVSLQPQRVVVLDTGELDNVLALAVKPIGAPVNDALMYQEYLADQLEGITDIGTISEPNLETILSLKPDLILGSKQRYEAIYEQLAQIAPTVFTESLRVPWQETFKVHAEALGKSAEAEQDDLATYLTEGQ